MPELTADQIQGMVQMFAGSQDQQVSIPVSQARAVKGVYHAIGSGQEKEPEGIYTLNF
jgi:hypothetical protein